MSDVATALDEGVIEQLKDLLGTMFGELVTRFINDGQARIRRIRTAQSPPDFDAVFAEAHGLKGSSQNVGAHGLENVCVTLEQVAKSGNATELQPNIAALEQEFAVVCAALQRTASN